MDTDGSISRYQDLARRLEHAADRLLRAGNGEDRFASELLHRYAAFVERLCPLTLTSSERHIRSSSGAMTAGPGGAAGDSLKAQPALAAAAPAARPPPASSTARRPGRSLAGGHGAGHRGRVEPRRRTSCWNSATAQLEWVASSRELAAALAQNYTGLPYDQGWSYP